MAKLVLMRHGQSLWNKNNLFTGWVDVPLSKKGVEEALKAGERIKHIPFDQIFVSTLCRAQMTAYLAIAVHDEGKTPVVQHPGEGKMEEWGAIYSEKSAKESIPVTVAWQLNERMYGELQGLNKDETRAQFGADQVKIWRRSFDTAPPQGESLKMTAERTLPYFDETIVPLLVSGKNVLISAHGNSLRAIVMKLDSLSADEVVQLEIPTGEPICYTFDSGSWTKNSI